MLGITRKKVLKVSLLDISPHNRAILEFFFAGAGSRLFKTTAQSEADAFIVDFDHPNAQKNWEKINENLNKPTLALAFYETNAKNTIWLGKPLTTQALSDAADKIQTLLNENRDKSTSDLSTIKKQATAKKVTSNISIIKALAAKRASANQRFINPTQQKKPIAHN